MQKLGFDVSVVIINIQLMNAASSLYFCNWIGNLNCVETIIHNVKLQSGFCQVCVHIHINFNVFSLQHFSAQPNISPTTEPRLSPRPWQNEGWHQQSLPGPGSSNCHKLCIHWKQSRSRPRFIPESMALCSYKDFSLNVYQDKVWINVSIVFIVDKYFCNINCQD